MLDLAQNALYVYTVKFNKSQSWRGLRRILNGDMGCRGSEVRILSCRPTIYKKTNQLRLVFLCLEFGHGTAPSTGHTNVSSQVVRQIVSLNG